MFRLICLCIGYCIGCIETAYVVGRIWQVDLRQHGSGNARYYKCSACAGKKGRRAGIHRDIMKSVIAFVICRCDFGSNLAGVYGSVGAVLGHNYPFYLNFKGGKGIAVMIGMTAAMAFSMDIRLAIPNALIGFGMAFATRYVSVGSLLFALTLPISAYLLGFPREMLYLTIFVSAMAFWRHRGISKKTFKRYGK